MSHRNFSRLCFAFLILSLVLVGTPVFANATLAIGLSGQGTDCSDTSNPCQILNASDPIALSGAISVSTGNVFFWGPSGGGAGAVDLTTGTLRILSAATLKTIPASGTAGPPSVSAQMTDVITLSGPGTQVSFTMSLDVDGTSVITWTNGVQPGASADAEVSADLSLATSLGNYEKTLLMSHSYSTDGAGVPTDSVVLLPSNDPDVTTTNNSSGVGWTATIHAMAQVGQPLNLTASLIAQQGSFTTPTMRISTDFGNTARIGLTLPPGYSFTSQSGAFLSNPSGAGLPLDGGTYPVVADAGGTGGGGDLGAGAGGADLSAPGSGGNSKSGGCSEVGSAAGASTVAGLLAAALALLAVRRRRDDPRSI